MQDTLPTPSSATAPLTPFWEEIPSVSFGQVCEAHKLYREAVELLNKLEDTRLAQPLFKRVKRRAATSHALGDAYWGVI
jgi:hypothetical protein